MGSLAERCECSRWKLMSSTHTVCVSAGHQQQRKTQRWESGCIWEQMLRKMEFPFSLAQGEKPLPSGWPSPPISPWVQGDRQAQHTHRHTLMHLQFRSKAAFLIHTEALTVRQSIFSEGWSPPRTCKQSEGGVHAMKGPVIAFDRCPYKDVVHQMPTDKKPSAKSLSAV